MQVGDLHRSVIKTVTAKVRFPSPYKARTIPLFPSSHLTFIVEANNDGILFDLMLFSSIFLAITAVGASILPSMFGNNKFSGRHGPPSCCAASRGLHLVGITDCTDRRATSHDPRPNQWEFNCIVENKVLADVTYLPGRKQYQMDAHIHVFGQAQTRVNFQISCFDETGEKIHSDPYHCVWNGPATERFLSTISMQNSAGVEKHCVVNQQHPVSVKMVHFRPGQIPECH